MHGLLGGQKSDKKKTAIEDSSSIFAQKRKQTNVTEGRGGPEGKTTPKDEERQRMKNE